MMHQLLKRVSVLIIYAVVGFYIFGMLSAIADERNFPIIVENHLAEYCVAVLSVTNDPEFTPASEWLKSISDFDADVADIFYTQLLLSVELSELDPAVIRVAAAECNDAYETNMEEHNNEPEKERAL